MPFLIKFPLNTRSLVILTFPFSFIETILHVKLLDFFCIFKLLLELDILQSLFEFSPNNPVPLLKSILIILLILSRGSSNLNDTLLCTK